MSTPFPVKPGQQVWAIAHGNAVYRHPDKKDKPIPGEIVSFGRKYIYAIIDHTETRFLIKDFTSADKDDNAHYELFPTEQDAWNVIHLRQNWVALRNLLGLGPGRFNISAETADIIEDLTAILAGNKRYN